MKQYDDARQRLIPEAQIATQHGVQAHDPVSPGSSGVMSLPIRTPLYVTGKLHKKVLISGILSASGFCNGVQISSSMLRTMFNVPSEPCKAGDTDPIDISGVTKQGRPHSPLKSALIFTLSPSESEKHLLMSLAAADSLSVSFSMVEATDCWKRGIGELYR